VGFESNSLDFLPMESRRWGISRMLLLKDRLTGNPIVGESELTLDHGTPPVRKSGSLYALVDLEEGEDYYATVRSRYYNEMRERISSEGGGAEPLQTVEVWLDPSSAYPYPEGVSVLRGKVSDAAGLPVSGALCVVDSDGLRQPCDPFGNVALYWREGQTPPRSDWVTVSKEGYETARQEIFPATGTFFTIRLEESMSA
jgi:hypothetical protein